jgi:hypothetical protein
MKPQNSKSPGFSKLIENGLVEMVGYQTGGQTKKMPRLELMVLQKVLGAVQGDPGSVKFLLKHIGKRQPKIIENDILCEVEEPNGTLRTEYRDGRAAHLWPDGCRQIDYPDGRIKLIDEKGVGTWTSVNEMEALGNPTTLEELKLRRGF